jgi:hypothetical protein
MDEVIVDVIGFEGLYQISNFGDVYSLKTGVPVKLKPILNKRYRIWFVNLYHPSLRYWRKMPNGTMANHMRPKVCPIHVLVAKHFLPPKPTWKHTINHKDFNRANNAATNLEWMTFLQNTQHFHDSHPEYFRGENCPTAKLTNDEAREIYAARGSGPASRFAAQYSVSSPTIYNIWHGRRWAGVV